jgi:hypothetical protein
MARFGRAYPVGRIKYPAVPLPILLDTVGAGNGGTGTAPTTWSVSATVTAGSYVFGIFMAYGSGTRTPGSVVYGGVSMAMLSGPNTQGLCVYGLANAPGGSQNFSGTKPANSSWNGNVISFLNVSLTDGTVDTTSGAAAGAASQTVNCKPSQHILQVFTENVNGNNALTGLSGGTNQFNGRSLVINDATASTTFNATTTAGWDAVGIRMNPIPLIPSPG